MKAIQGPRQLTDWEAGVLTHASNTGRYVTDEERVIALGKEGLLKDYGPQRLADGMHYLVMTCKGREALSAWRAVQPRPQVVKRRKSKEFAAWQRWSEAFGSISFSEFHQAVWPEVREEYRYV